MYQALVISPKGLLRYVGRDRNSPLPFLDRADARLFSTEEEALAAAVDTLENLWGVPAVRYRNYSVFELRAA